MNTIKFISCLGIFFFMISCGSDDCTSEDWIGTFNLDDSTVECSDSIVMFGVSSLVITAGSSESTVTALNEEYTIDNCSITTDIGEAVLDGDKLRITGPCNGIFNRQ